mgnify:CR=1 FL=1
MNHQGPNEGVLNEARKLIGQFMATRRKELGLSQADLAERSGMSLSSIKRFELGLFWPSMKHYLIFCHHLRCYPYISTMENDEQFATLMREMWTRPDDKN